MLWDREHRDHLTPGIIMGADSSDLGDIPPEIACLSWEELVQGSVPFPKGLLRRVCGVTEGVHVDLDEAFADDFVPPWEHESLPDESAPPSGED